MTSKTDRQANTNFKALSHLVSTEGHLLRGCLQPSKDRNEIFATLSQILPLRAINSALHSQGCWHEHGAFQLPSLPIGAWRASFSSMETVEHPHNTLLLLHDGMANVTQGQHNVQFSAGDAVFLSGKSFTVDFQYNSSFTALIIDSSFLFQQANSLAHLAWIDPPYALLPQEAPLYIHRRHQKNNILMDAIDHLLLGLIQLSFLHPELRKKVLPTPALMRLVTILIFDLTKNVVHPLDPVLKYIIAHLGEPLTLKEIEKTTNYSSRTLQYAFHDRCGCSPMQWIRRQRILLAHQKLLDLKVDEPIYKVALACGYRSLSRFNHDYKKVFGAPPSMALREGKFSMASQTA